MKANVAYDAYIFIRIMQYGDHESISSNAERPLCSIYGAIKYYQFKELVNNYVVNPAKEGTNYTASFLAALTGWLMNT